MPMYSTPRLILGGFKMEMYKAKEVNDSTLENHVGDSNMVDAHGPVAFKKRGLGHDLARYAMAAVSTAGKNTRTAKIANVPELSIQRSH